MNFHRESAKESYDVIVIGAGIGGLTAGALLAKAGRSVLIIERHDRPGGYAHGFSRRQYRFDSGVHAISGCGEEGYRNGQVIYKILKSLNIQDQLEFIPLDPYAYACFPGIDIPLVQGEQAFVHRLAECFPGERVGLEGLVRLAKEIAEQAAIADEVMSTEHPGASRETLATLFKYRRSSLSTAMDEFIRDPWLKGILATLWPYMGLPPRRLSFLYWAMMFIGFTIDGACYCRGSFQRMADVLAQASTDNGGEVLYKTSVHRIMVSDDQVCGVVTENGQQIRAPVVISNADALQTFEHLLGAQHAPTNYLKTLNKLSISTSAFVVYIATDLDLKAQRAKHEAFYFDSFDHESNYTLSLEGDVQWFSATVPTLTDPSLAPAGTHLIMLTTLMPYQIDGSWRTSKQRYLNQLLEKAEHYFPGLNDHLLLVESGSPRTMERYTLNHQGAAYGWDATPSQIGPGRPGTRSPIPGLYLAGHWSTPGAGVYGVSVSGVLAAQAILEIPEQSAFWRYFQR